MSEQPETSENMPADYVTKEVLTSAVGRVGDKVDNLKESVDNALEKMAKMDERLIDTEKDVAIMKANKANNRWLLLAAFVVIGAISNLDKIISMFKH